MTRCVGYPTLKGHKNPNDGDYIILDPSTSTVPPHDKVSAQRHRPLMAHRTGNDTCPICRPPCHHRQIRLRGNGREMWGASRARRSTHGHSRSSQPDPIDYQRTRQPSHQRALERIQRLGHPGHSQPSLPVHTIESNVQVHASLP